MSQSPSIKKPAPQKPLDVWFMFQWSVWWFIVYLTVLAVWYVLGIMFSQAWSSEQHIASLMFGNQIFSNHMLLGHIATACPCIIVGPVLFLPRFRKKHMKWHRVLGFIYIFTIIPSAILGFVLALHSAYGVWAKAGFGLLAITWFTTTVIGYVRVRQKQIFSHRRWMIRSYAVSIAVLTVRFLVIPPEGWTRLEWFPFMTWLCWVPNLLAAEFYLCISDDKGRFKMPGLLWPLFRRQKMSA